MGSLAVLAAEKIMEREIDADRQKDIVDRIIEEAEEKTWK